MLRHRVRYVSPARRALSFTLMPPITVRIAKGTAIGRYCVTAMRIPATNPSDGHGNPMVSDSSGRARGCSRRPAAPST